MFSQYTILTVLAVLTILTVLTVLTVLTILIAINQDPLGIQAKKVAINDALTHHFVGLAPCAVYEADAHYPDGVPGHNGVTKVQ
jgi:hypothetical protein